MSYKMKGSPLLKDIKMYQGDGSQIMVDDSTLGEVYMDDNGNKTRDYTYTNKDGKEGVDILYLNKPRGKSKWKGGPKLPRDKPIDEEQFFA